MIINYLDYIEMNSDASYGLILDSAEIIVYVDFKYSYYLWALS